MFASLFTSALNVIGAFFGWQSKREEAAQAAPLVKAKTAQIEQQADDQTAAEIGAAMHGAPKDSAAALRKIREEASE